MQRGDVVKSLKGRDKDCIYVVIHVDNGTAYLANGRNRKVENPKKKNAKHLEVVLELGCDISVTDLDLRKYCKI
jgi:ribosomal protein L14E/L6E/L27E